MGRLLGFLGLKRGTDQIDGIDGSIDKALNEEKKRYDSGYR